jgi:hypothetical protein
MRRTPFLLLTLLIAAFPVRVHAAPDDPLNIRAFVLFASIFGEAPASGATGHDGMHAMLEQRFGEHSLPAWLVEGLAAYAQPAEERERTYWSALRVAPDRLNSLDGLLSTPYADRDAASSCSRGNDSAQYALFAAQSLALVEFLAESEGDAFVGRMAAAMALGADLRRSVSGAATLSGDAELLQVQWFLWMRARGVHTELRLGTRPA